MATDKTVALITGANKGLGLEIARQLGKRVAEIGLTTFRMPYTPVTFRDPISEDTEVVDVFAPPREDFLAGGTPSYMHAP